MISIIDYGVGNIKSIYKAINAIGFDGIVTKDKKVINNSKAIILPGVGAFRDAMKNLKRDELDRCIVENARRGKLILGICLGMQLLYDESFEDGRWNGLGLLKGKIVEFKGNIKIPHMGWNRLEIKRKDTIIKYIEERDYVYFVHSYYADSTYEDVICTCEYETKFPAIVGKNNIYGMQFHPEKSGNIGLKLLKAFGELI